MLEKIVNLFNKGNEEDAKKKYVPFGENPSMRERTDVNSNLRELIENKDSILILKN